jgi:hypothetical protein
MLNIVPKPAVKIKASPNPSEGGGLPPLWGGLGRGCFLPSDAILTDCTIWALF